MSFYFVSLRVNERGCGLFEWNHEPIGSFSSNSQNPRVDTPPARATEIVVRHVLEMELHASH